jgi:uncharacterized protein (DUF433 family)
MAARIRLSPREQEIIEIVRENDRREQLAEDFNERIAKIRDFIDEHKGYVRVNAKAWPVVYADLIEFPERD